jgi:hypothetical protein
LRTNQPEINMLSKTVYSMMVLTVAFAAEPISAQPVTTQSATDVCKVAASRIQPHAERARVQAEFAKLSATCLKELYLQCSREASQNLLGFSEASSCSFGHEALLKGEFGGDFNELLTWWQAHRGDPVGQ